VSCLKGTGTNSCDPQAPAPPRQRRHHHARRD
jgi:hypothetical protein